MSVALGISIGSEACIVALYALSSGRMEVLVNDVGDRLTPTYVAYISGDVLGGLPAKQSLIRQPMQTVPHVLALTTIETARKVRVACEVDINETDDTIIFPSLDPEHEGTKHDCNELLTLFLAKVKETVVDAACVAGVTIDAVTVAVPRYANVDTVKTCMCNAGFSAYGANAIQVIYDDVAGLLASGFCLTPASVAPYAAREAITSGLELKSLVHPQVALVIDWGALSLSSAIFLVRGGSCTLGEQKTAFGVLGGKKLDEEIALQLAQGFQRKSKMDPMENSRCKRRLLQVAETLKKTLTASMSASAEIEAFFEGVDLKEQFSRVKLESLIREKGYAAFLEAHVASALESFLDGKDLEARNQELSTLHVVLQGGMFRIPLIASSAQQAIRNAVNEKLSSLSSPTRGPHVDPTSPFPKAGTKSNQIYFEAPAQATDELIALGACSQSMIVLNRLSKMTAQQAKDGGIDDLERINRPRNSTNTLEIPVLHHDLFLLTSADLSCVAKQPNPVMQLSEKDGQVTLLACAGTPLPCDVVIDIDGSASANESSMVFLQRAPPNVLNGDATFKQEEGKIPLISVLSKPVQVPKGTVKVQIVFFSGEEPTTQSQEVLDREKGHLECRFFSADAAGGVPSSVIKAVVEGSLE